MTTTKKAPSLPDLSASEMFDRMMHNDEWNGFGYLGERRNAVETVGLAHVARVDALVAAYTADWTDAERFEWANSKPGRWFGDVVFGGGTFDEAVRHGLLVKVEAE